MIELTQQDPKVFIIPESTAMDLGRNVEQMGAYLVQMAHMITRINDRMDEIEARERRITISHQQVLDLGALIRMRARQICDKYDLQPADERAIKGTIKREMLQKYNIKDFHDLPEVALPEVRRNVDRWVNIRIVMQRRQLHQETGP